MGTREFIKTIDTFDQKLILKCNGVGGKPFTYFMKFISFFGRETIWFMIIAFYLFIWYDRFLFVYIGVAFMNGLLLILLVKETVNRPRPFETLGDKIEILEREPSSRSFPSWHVYNVTSQGLLLGYLLNSILLTILLMIFVALVAFSEMQLGVHYFSDIMVGFLLGILGFLLALFLIGPICLAILIYLEQFAIYGIQLHRINSMIFTEIWYITLCIGIYAGIILSATFKIIEDYFQKRKG